MYSTSLGSQQTGKYDKFQNYDYLIIGPFVASRLRESGNTWLIIYLLSFLTHWDRVTHICISKLNSIGSDNGLAPGWRQAIIWANAGILLIRPLATNFCEILIRVQTFSFKKMHYKCHLWNGVISFRPQCVKNHDVVWWFEDILVIMILNICVAESA